MLKYGISKKRFVESLRRVIDPIAQASGAGPCLLYTHVAVPLLQRLLPADRDVVWGFGALSVPLVRLLPPTMGRRSIGEREKCSIANGAFHSWVMVRDGERVEVLDFALGMFRDRSALTRTEHPIVPKMVWAVADYRVTEDLVVLRLPWRRMYYMHFPDQKANVVAWIQTNNALLVQMVEAVSINLTGRSFADL